MYFVEGPKKRKCNRRDRCLQRRNSSFRLERRLFLKGKNPAANPYKPHQNLDNVSHGTLFAFFYDVVLTDGICIHGQDCFSVID